MVHVGVNPPDGELKLTWSRRTPVYTFCWSGRRLWQLKSTPTCLLTHPRAHTRPWAWWTLKETPLLHFLGHLWLLKSCPNSNKLNKLVQAKPCVRNTEGCDWLPTWYPRCGIYCCFVFSISIVHIQLKYLINSADCKYWVFVYCIFVFCIHFNIRYQHQTWISVSCVLILHYNLSKRRTGSFWY